MVCKEKRVKKLIARPTFKCRTIYMENLCLVKMEKESVVFDKPIYAGFAVLELSKTLIYRFHYDVMQVCYGDRLQLAYMDTDSFVYQIQTEDFYNDLTRDPNFLAEFDMSAYPPTHPCYSPVNKKVVGKFKDECCGEEMSEFRGLRAKLYT